jgi:sugar lactone lactonase YvrE
MIPLLGVFLGGCGAGTAGIIAGSGGGDGSTTVVEPTTLRLLPIEGAQEGQVRLGISLQAAPGQVLRLTSVEYSLTGVNGPFRTASPSDDPTTSGADYPNEILVGQTISGNQLASTPGPDVLHFVWNAAHDLDELVRASAIQVPLTGRAMLRAEVTNLTSGAGLIDTTNAFVLDQRLVQTMAGGGVGDGTVPADACLLAPEGLATDVRGALYIADTGNSRVRKLDRRADGVLAIETIAGNGFAGFAGALATALQTGLSSPRAVAVAADGDVFLSEQLGDAGMIRRLDQSTGLLTVFINAAGLTRRLRRPAGLAVGPTKSLWVADEGSGEVWRIRVDAVPITDDDISVIAGLRQPTDVAVVAEGTGEAAYVVERGENRVIRILAGAGAQNFAGTGTTDPTAFAAEDLVGVSGVTLSLFEPAGIAASTSHVFVCARGRPGGPAAIVALERTSGEVANVITNPALLQNPTGLALDRAGNLFILEGGNGSPEIGLTAHRLLAVHQPEVLGGAETEAMAGQDSMRDASQGLDGSGIGTSPILGFQNPAT